MRRQVKMLAWIAGGTEVVRYVARLALEQEAALTLTEVIDQSEMIVRPVYPGRWSVPTQARREALDRLDRAAHQARRAGFVAKVQLLVGHPVEALVGHITRREYDLLAIAAPPPRRRARYTAARLARECPKPVLVIQPSTLPSRQVRVLVAIDTGGWRGVRLESLNKRLFNVAQWLVGPEGHLHVLHVWQAHEVGFIRRGGASESKIRSYVAQVRENRTRELERAVALLRRQRQPVSVHLKRGDPRSVIPAVARQHRIDVVVVGTTARRGVARWVIGNTAEAVLANMPCSLLVVPPDSRF